MTHNWDIYHYYDSATNTTTSDEVNTIDHGVFVMRTELRKYVPNTSKQGG